MTEAAFRRDTAVVPDPTAPGRWSATIHEGWSAPAGPNGGYLAALAGRAMEAAVDDPTRPLRSLTLHYLRRSSEAPVRIETTVERAGRSLSTVSCRFVQDDRTTILAVGALAAERQGADFDDARMPEAPPPDRCQPLPRPPFPLPIRDRFECRLAVGGDVFTESPQALTGGWIRLADGEPADACALLAFTDAWPPAVFTRITAPMAVPTVGLTIHVRRPVPEPSGWFLVVFRTRLSAGGYLEEDGEVWSEDGRLLAQSRQLALASLL